MLSASCGRYIGYSTLQDLQQCLLNAFTRNIPCDRAILGFTGDLVDLVHVDDTLLRPFHIILSDLYQSEQDVFNVLANVAGFCQSCRIGDGKRYIQYFCKRLRQ